MRFGADTRIGRSSEFQRIVRSGRRVRVGALSVQWERGRGASRIGLVVARGRCSAVQRNRVRRMLRESFRAAVVEGDLPAEEVDVVMRISTERGAVEGRGLWALSRAALRRLGERLDG